MVAREYIPDAGDLVWVDFTPPAGREPAGRLPAVVLSASAYNEKTSLAVMCPITSHSKGYPFEVAIPAGLRVQGVVLTDHLRSLDWRQRQAQKAGKIPRGTLNQILHRISILLGIS